MYFCPLETSRSTLLPKAPCLLRYSLRAKSASSVSPQNVKILSTESRKFAACASLKKSTGFPYSRVASSTPLFGRVSLPLMVLNPRFGELIEFI